MDSGPLDRKITLERFSTTYNEFNEPFEGWATLAVRSASKDDVSDGEKLRAAQVGATITSRFRVRYDSVTSTLTAADRLTYEGKQFSIVGTKEIGRREGIEITASVPNDNLQPEPTP
jgi:SPP1 family predicted phage head-tail adaptor